MCPDDLEDLGPVGTNGGFYNNQRAPILIDFMLACYTRPEPCEALGEAHWDSPAGRQTRLWLRENDLIDDNYRPTERGAAWVRFICDTPLPVAVWTLPERRTEA